MCRNPFFHFNRLAIPPGCHMMDHSIRNGVLRSQQCQLFCRFLFFKILQVCKYVVRIILYAVFSASIIEYLSPEQNALFRLRKAVDGIRIRVNIKTGKSLPGMYYRFVIGLRSALRLCCFCERRTISASTSSNVMPFSTIRTRT